MELRFKDEKSDIRDQYYAVLDSINRNDNGSWQLIFDSIQISKFNDVANSNIREMFPKVEPVLFIVSTEDEFFKSYMSFLWYRSYYGQWFILKTTNDSTSLSAQISVENSEIPEISQTFIHSIELLPRNTVISRNLDNFFSWVDINRNSEILEYMGSLPSCLNHKLNIYNVGQGSLSAVVDENDNPLLYFDMGGSWWIHLSSYRRTLNLCFSKAKTVIISHWDLDHVESARRLFYSNPMQLQGITWIAPQQFLSPLYSRLAAKMFHSGKLLFWTDKSIQCIDFWAGQLIKCRGYDKNNSGIALMVKSPNNSIKSVLHPADADYGHILQINQIELDGLIATHHGGKFNNSYLPVSIFPNGAVAYSYGQANSYGHPNSYSVEKYQLANWSNRKDTKMGNISFTKTPYNKPVLYTENQCDLSINQTF